MQPEQSSAETYEIIHPKEKAIIDFVASNPSSTKQIVVDALDGKYSRVIVFDTIKELVKYNIITIIKDKPNSQVHKLYVNKENPILGESEKISDFESAIIILLLKIKKQDLALSSQLNKDIDNIYLRLHVREKMESIRTALSSNEIDKREQGVKVKKLSRTLWNKVSSTEAYSRRTSHKIMYIGLFNIFWQITQVYNLLTAFVWPIQIGNKMVLNRLIRSTLAKLASIQIKMARIISDVTSLEERFVILDKDINIREGSIYEETIKDFKKETNVSEDLLLTLGAVYRRQGLGNELADLERAVKCIKVSLEKEEF